MKFGSECELSSFRDINVYGFFDEGSSSSGQHQYKLATKNVPKRRILACLFACFLLLQKWSNKAGGYIIIQHLEPEVIFPALSVKHMIASSKKLLVYNSTKYISDMAKGSQVYFILVTTFSDQVLIKA